MGFFTWTVANKTPKTTKFGFYSLSCTLRYDGYGAIVCPDNTLIKESCYEGYGKFDGKDVYDLVADWNREKIPEIVKMDGFKMWNIFSEDPKHMELLYAFASDDKDRLNKAIEAVAEDSPYMREDWKRTIGILLACDNNHLLPYPIKIVDCQHPRPYDKLRPSISTQ